MLHRLLAFDAVEAVVAPFLLGDRLEEGGLADALGADERQDVVVLDAGRHHPGHGGAEVLARHRPGEVGVRSSEVIHEQVVETRLPVPGESVEVVAHGVKIVLAGVEVEGVEDAGLRREVVVSRDVVDQAVVVRVVPVLVELHRAPGQVLRQDVAAAEEVAPDAALELRVVAQYESEVEGRGLRPALAVDLQLLHPVLVLLVGHIGEVLVDGVDALADHQGLDPGLLAGEAVHRQEGRQLGHGGVDVGVLVQLSELVQPDEVEGVAQLLTAGVRAVVAVGPFVLVYDESAGRGAVDIGVAVIVPCRGIHVAQEGFYRLGDGVAAAEGSDDARLCRRILLLPAVGPHTPDGAAVHRPLRHVAPVGVAVEDFVGVEGISGGAEEDVLPVHGAAGPVHQPAGLIRRAVEEVYVDPFGDTAGNGYVFVRRDVSGEGYHEPVAGRLRGVRMCAVERPGAGQHIRDDVGRIILPEVYVECHQGAALDAVPLAPAAVYLAADEASLVFCPALLILAHSGILSHGLTGADHLGESLHELPPGHELVLPLLVGAGAAQRYLVFSFFSHQSFL